MPTPIRTGGIRRVSRNSLPLAAHHSEFIGECHPEVRTLEASRARFGACRAHACGPLQSLHHVDPVFLVFGIVHVHVSEVAAV